MFDQPKTETLRTFINREFSAGRVTGLSIEPDGVFIYTDSTVWCDDSGAGTFRGDSEADAIRKFVERVRPAQVAANVHCDAVLHSAHLRASDERIAAEHRWHVHADNDTLDLY